MFYFPSLLRQHLSYRKAVVYVKYMDEARIYAFFHLSALHNIPMVFFRSRSTITATTKSTLFNIRDFYVFIFKLNLSWVFFTRERRERANNMRILENQKKNKKEVMAAAYSCRKTQANARHCTKFIVIRTKIALTLLALTHKRQQGRESQTYSYCTSKYSHKNGKQIAFVFSSSLLLNSQRFRKTLQHAECVFHHVVFFSPKYLVYTCTTDSFLEFFAPLCHSVSYVYLFSLYFYPFPLYFMYIFRSHDKLFQMDIETCINFDSQFYVFRGVFFVGLPTTMTRIVRNALVNLTVKIKSYNQRAQFQFDKFHKNISRD